MNDELSPATRRLLDQRLEAARAAARLPALAAALLRDDGSPLWTGATGSVDGRPPGGDTQFRVGSITKTFTAVLVLRLREEGLLGLDDRLDRHLPGLPEAVGAATVAQLLAHTAGLPLDPPESPRPEGPRPEGPHPEGRRSPADLLGEPPVLHPAGAAHHYSNVGYALLGALVERHRQTSWDEALAAELLRPLGMRRTTRRPQAPAAGGWSADPRTGAPRPEPALDFGALAPAGQYWSTLGDLARWAAFLARGREGVLSAAAVAGMRRPAVVEGCYGLGLELWREDGAEFAGHTGSVPGFRAALLLAPAAGLTGIVLGNSSTPVPGGADGLARDLIRHALRD
ncbi:serine hydrolase domain-containing protein [Kitasatospora sp. NPDC051853]|uniref:serine hydrolase domain-containing protein n=1 Tax=Kitasatospora sp. NPDC051853 TaxID=3364058 RepID=UPI0037B6D864